MDSRLTDRLCTKCGLCCDGSLLADVELTGKREAERLEAMGLEIDDDGPLLLLPCRALRGTLCSVYAHRPKTCRSFECRLLRDVGLGKLAVEAAEKAIADTLKRTGRLRRLAAALGAGDEPLPLRELCLEALTPGEGAPETPAFARRRSKLEGELAELDRLLEERFLASGEAGEERRSTE